MKGEIKKTVRDAFIVSANSSPVSTDADLEKLSWQEAGHLAFWIAGLGFGCFGLHYFFFGTGKGEPPRQILIMIFSLLALGPSSAFSWKSRLRYFAAYASGIAVVGLFLRFVVHDSIAFSPVFLVGQALLMILLWTASDWNKKLRARAKERKQIAKG